jgi:hypothetical protein
MATATSGARPAWWIAPAAAAVTGAAVGVGAGGGEDGTAGVESCGLPRGAGEPEEPSEPGGCTESPWFIAAPAAGRAS